MMLSLLLLSSCTNISSTEDDPIDNSLADFEWVGDSVNYAGAGDYVTFNQVQEKYPDKTVLVWQLEMGTADVRTEQVNEYLVSLGKDYVVCFEPMVPHFANEEGLTHFEGVKSKLQNGGQIDILYTAYTVSGKETGTPYKNFHGEDLLISLDRYLESTDIGRSLYSLIPEKMWQASRINGEIFGIANYTQFFNNNVNSYYLYNSSLVDKYGYNITASMESQLDIVAEIVRQEDVYAYLGSLNDFAHISLWGADNYLVLSEDKTKYVSILEDECYLENLKTFFELSKSGYVTQNISKRVLRSDLITPEFLNAEWLYTVDGTNYYISINKKADSTIKMPGTVTGICTYSKHQDDAFDLLALSLTDEYLNNLLTYGTENDYKTENGIVVETSSLQNFMRFANVFVCMPSSQNSTNPSYCRERIDSSEISLETEFCLDSRDFIHETISLDTQFQSILWNAYNVSDTWEDFISTITNKTNDAGLQIIVDKANTQYSEWRNTQ